jgi:hypothetical protein
MISGMAAPFRYLALLSALSAVPCWHAATAAAQGRRDHTRPTHTRETAAVEKRETEISLTVAPVAEQLLQTWIRTAGVIDAERKVLSACVTSADAELIRSGQRVRAFPPDSKSSIYQARVRGITPGRDCVAVEAALSGTAYGDATYFVMEIIIDRGQVLAIANAAIIEREGVELVYEQIHPGHYEPHEIHTGRKGETYTEVLDGVTVGMPIVTIGSFFIDADYRLKTTPGNGMDAGHHH